jgi:succinyl-CoA synthetase alpha subunit
MAIFVNEHTKVIVQGLTGGQGKYHGLRNRPTAPRSSGA